MLRISIITVVFNGANHIRNAIESVFAQKYDNLEYIIVDGGSTDGTLEIIQEYKEFVDIVVSEPDNGISDAFNKGIRLASGSLIGLINSDDILLPGALAEVDAAWQSAKFADVFYGNQISMNDEQKQLWRVYPAKNMEAMSYSMAISHPATFVTKNAYEKFGMFDLNYRCAMDYELLLRFYRRGAVFKGMDYDVAVMRMGGTNQKFREKTLVEVRKASIMYGGNAFIAYGHYFLKKLKDIIRRSLSNLKLLDFLQRVFGRSERVELSENLLFRQGEK